ncbi:hypothetical protein [Streptomyces sp. Ac-502]|uniref:hypothetical protein n=1 Tax=Streptomyces sp. Ac-502 TaxID=3342801 RepID=UPI0038627FDB
MSERQSAAIRRLEALVERVAPRDEAAWERRPPLRRGRLVSGSRAKQLRATLAQLDRAVGHEGMPDRCGRSVKALLAPEAVDAFLELAAEGVFRSPDLKAAAGRALPWSTIATLRDCLVILGEEAGVAVVVPRVYRQRLDLAPVAGQEQLAAVYGRLLLSMRDEPVDALMARSLACAGLVLDARMRSGDLASRRVEHLHLDDEGVRGWRRRGRRRGRRGIGRSRGRRCCRPVRRRRCVGGCASGTGW